MVFVHWWHILLFMVIFLIGSHWIHHRCHCRFCCRIHHRHWWFRGRIYHRCHGRICRINQHCRWQWRIRRHHFLLIDCFRITIIVIHHHCYNGLIRQQNESSGTKHWIRTTVPFHFIINTQRITLLLSRLTSSIFMMLISIVMLFYF